MTTPELVKRRRAAFELRRRQELRAKRADAGVAFFGLACLAVAVVAGLALLLSEIPNLGLGG